MKCPLCCRFNDKTSAKISEKEELSHLTDKLIKIETEQKEVIPKHIRGTVLVNLLWYVISWQTMISNDKR